MPTASVPNSQYIKAICFSVSSIAWLSLAYKPVPAAPKRQARLSTEVAKGFASLRVSHWQRGQAHFEQAGASVVSRSVKK